MTTKYKIITGFAVITILLGVVAILGYSNISRTSASFTEYRQIARLNVHCSDIGTGINAAIAQVYHYLDEPKPEYLKTAHDAVGTLKQLIAKAESEALQDDRKEALKVLQAQVQKYDDMVDVVGKNTAEAYAQYTNSVVPSVAMLTDDINNLIRQAHSTGNIDAVQAIAACWPNLASGRVYLGRFAETRDQEYALTAHKFLETLTTDLGKVEVLITSPQNRALFQKINQANTAMMNSLDKMEALYQQVNTNLDVLGEYTRQMLAAIQKLNGEVDVQQNIVGPAILAANAEAQTYMLGVSAGGIIIGLLFAVIIVLGIVRVLNKLAVFAGAIAKGDFTHTLDIKEKGEIGIMVDAMSTIPQVLRMVSSEASALAASILSGGFRERLDTKKLQGSYADIAASVNMVSDAYTGAMDNLAIPLLCYTKAHEPLFLNTAAQSTFDGTEEPVVPGQDPKKELGKKAMESKAAQTVEASLNAKGKRMEASITAMPLFNMQKDVVGYMGFISDLTEIKAQQATMLNVAQQASEIADRVAAASEELAAQVEQISRGAEIQHQRVESTASAMTEMNSTVIEVARNAGEASDQSENTKKKAEEGSELVNQVVRAITSVNTVASALQVNMQELGQQAENIGGIMNVISDIADQTNLLALNAAIEAARAGEAGRGFAVVADEVRKLAEKTMTATQEVGASITAIQSSARTNIDEVSSAVKDVTTATELANSSGEALQEIVTMASANSSVVSSIATAAEEQSATSEEINRAIEEISTVVGETSEGITQSSAAVQDLSRMAQELRRVMEGLR